MDTMVAASQMWLNNHYTGVSGWNPVPENGLTGWTTVNAITRALQHELGITTLSDTFGPTTLSYLTSQVGSVGPSTTNTDIVALMQCGMWCKGYSGGEQFGDWTLSPALNSSLPSMRSAMGLGTTNALPPKAFKSLLTMDAYSIRAGGSYAIGDVQRWLNGTYYGRADYYLIPCDGLFSRDVQRGLMLAIQYELGMADGVANGNFGAGTQSGLQTYGVFGSGATDSTRKLVRLFKAALIFNGYEVPFSGTFDATTVAQTSAFQSFAALSATGGANFQTWAALLVSTGDPNRAVSATDTSTPLTQAKASTLVSAGYTTVGRYLNVESKRLQPGEFGTIFAAGLHVFPIYQEFNNAIQYFHIDAGRAQGEAAVRRARQLGLKTGTVIYFAVDVDATDDDITAAIVPFFQGVKESVDRSLFPTYQVGVYGTRNVCQRVSTAGYAVSSFVAGMSTGWSGNLGFPLPTNWSYDQIQTKTIGSGSGVIEIDRNAKAPGAPALASGDVKATPTAIIAGVPKFDESGWWLWAALSFLSEKSTAGAPLTAFDYAYLVLHYVRQPRYWLMPGQNPVEEQTLAAWTVYTPNPPSDLIGVLGDRYNATEFNFLQRFGVGPYYLAPADGRIGDTPHFAVSTLALLEHGVPALGDTNLGIGEYGGWVLDLVDGWDGYEAARVLEPGGELDVRTWFAENVGLVGTTYDRADMQADMAAMLCARALHADHNRTLDDVLREIYVGIGNNPGYLAAQFYAQRFGSRAALVTAAKNVFLQPWPQQLVIDHFLNERGPGTNAPELNPSQAVRDSELEDFANGFADAVEAAMTWTTVD